MTPKYLNTSDTPAFKKSRNLYALNFAKNSKHGYFILCEGYMDVITMHQAGFTNAVASLGTAVTSEHARNIAKYTKTIALAYDSDEAGQRAMEKAALLLNEVGVEVKALAIEGAKDPDEYIKRFGKEKFENAVKDSKGYINSKIDYIYKKYDINGEDGSEQKIKAINEICEILSGLNSELEQEVYAAEAARKYGVATDSMIREIKRLTASRLRKEKNEIINSDLRKSEGLNDRINPDTIKNPKAANLEEDIIGMLMLYPELYMDSGISEDIFITEFNKKIFTVFENAIKENGVENFDAAFVAKEFSAYENGRIKRIMVSGMKHTDNGKHRLAKLIGALGEENDKQTAKSDDIITDGDKWADYIRSKRDGK